MSTAYYFDPCACTWDDAGHVTALCGAHEGRLEADLAPLRAEVEWLRADAERLGWLRVLPPERVHAIWLASMTPSADLNRLIDEDRAGRLSSPRDALSKAP